MTPDSRVPWETMVVTAGLLLLYTELVKTRETLARLVYHMERAEKSREEILAKQIATLSIIQNAPQGQMTTALGGGANVGGAQSTAGDVHQAV